jgi:predicted alpha/beta-hydrolase family hydrolase
MTTATADRAVSTPHGEGRLVTHRARGALATLLLSHGAGRGIDTRDLEALARDLPRQGITVALFEQPWRVAGGKVASPPATLDGGFIAAARALRARAPLVVGGRSAGARSAARTARGLGAAGCLALAFPLHPPGRPDKSRLHELREVGVPTLVVQGERDTFGRPEEFPEDLPAQIDVAVVPSADHGFAVPKRASVTQEDAMAVIVESTLEWLVREVTGNR